MLVLLGGCDRGSQSEVVINFWAMGREGEVVRELIPEFERRNPGIRVRVQQIPWSAAHEKLLTAYAGDTMPDLFQLGNTWIPEFVALRAIPPLDERIETSRAVSPADYFPGIWDTNRLDGRLYGVPWYVDTRVIFYRKDILARAGVADMPRSWAGWLEAMDRIRAGAGPDQYAILLPINDWTAPVILALQQGAALLRDSARYGAFEAQAFRKAFDFYLDLFRQGYAPPVGGSQMTNIYQAFARGEFAMYISGPWNIGEFRTRLPEALQDSWATAPLPSPDEHWPGVSLAGGASLAISRTSPHPQAAWRLIEYLSEPEQQLRFNRLTGDLPARKSAWRLGRLGEDRHAQAFWVQLQHLRPTPKIPEWERIAHKIAEYSEAVIRSDATPDEALAELDRDVDRILEKRRWLADRRGAGRP
jgi:multiple sugar transport system substrate-binding protein